MPRSPLAPFLKKIYPDYQAVNADEIPLKYKSLEAEWKSVRQNWGILDLSHQKKILVQGKDRISFLHRMLTNDIQKLKPGERCAACLLTPKGKIISDMTVYAEDSFHILELGISDDQKIIDHLSKYTLIDDVLLDLISDRWGLISFQGPESPRAIQPLDHRWHFFPNSRTGEQGYDLLFPVDQTQELWNALQSFKPLHFVGREAQEVLRIEAGIPKFEAELNQDIIPNEANLENAVSFTKGCYPGQEIVARIKYRGGIQKKLYGLEIMTNFLPQKNDPVQIKDHVIGFLTSVCFSPCLQKNIALGFLKASHIQENAVVEIHSQEHIISAVMRNLPFYSAKAHQTLAPERAS